MRRIFVNTEFPGHYPVGTAAIMVARDRGHARRLLIREARDHGLSLRADDLPLNGFTELSLEESGCVILRNGDY